MSGLWPLVVNFLDTVGWMMGVGLFMLFVGLFGYALLWIAGEDDKKEDRR